MRMPGQFSNQGPGGHFGGPGGQTSLPGGPSGMSMQARSASPATNGPPPSYNSNYGTQQNNNNYFSGNGSSGAQIPGWSGGPGPGKINNEIDFLSAGSRSRNTRLID